MIKDKPQRPVLAPFILGVLMFVAYKWATLPAFLEWGRLALLAISIALLLGAIWNGIIYMARDASDLAIDTRWRWLEPQIRLMENATKMDEHQLRFAREAGLINGAIDVLPAGIQWHYNTPWGPLTPDWVEEHLKLCARTWPIFPTIGRFHEGSLEYKMEYAFNHWMAMWSLAEARPGQEYVWKVTQAEVRKAIFAPIQDEEEEG